MGVTVGDLLAQLIKDRDEALATSDETLRKEKAGDVLRDAMFVMHKILGQDLLGAACGQVDESDRVAVLTAIAQRVATLAGVFGIGHGDAASPMRVAEEAMAVARGDAPLLFARLGGHKVNHRIAQAKFEALQWDAYLKGMGLPAGQRQPLIAKAFGGGVTWDTIRRAWRRDVQAVYPKPQYDYMLALALVEGKRRSPRWAQQGDPDWESALRRDGERYKQVLLENYGNR